MSGKLKVNEYEYDWDIADQITVANIKDSIELLHECLQDEEVEEEIAALKIAYKYFSNKEYEKGTK